MLEMRQGAVDMVGQEGAAGAARLPTGTEHEMIDHQLAAAVEELAERLLSLRRLEDVVLLDLDPGQGCALGGKLVP